MAGMGTGREDAPSRLPVHIKRSVLSTSTPKHPDLSSAAKVISPPLSLALGQQEGLSHVSGRQDLLKLTYFPHAPINEPECDNQEC